MVNFEPGKVLIPEMSEDYVKGTYEDYSGKITEAVGMQRCFGHSRPIITLSRGDFAAWRKCFSDDDFHWIFQEISRQGITFIDETKPVLKYVPLLVGWDPPTDDRLMINVDAAARHVFGPCIIFSNAYVARYRDGKVILADACDSEFRDQSHLAEYSAVWNALLVGRQLGSNDIIVPCDNQTVVDELNTKDRAKVLENTKFDTDQALKKYQLQEQIWNESEKYGSVEFRSVYREQNRYADFIASNWGTPNWKNKDFWRMRRQIEESDRQGCKYLRLNEIKKKKKKKKKKDEK